MRKVEASIVTLGFLGLFAALVKYSGGPRTWDELLYMHTAINPSTLGAIWNRYFHIYLQRPFLLLAPDFLQGAKVCWSLLFSITALFIYVNARIIGKRAYCGFLAVCFFFSITNWGHYAGITYPDVTVMMLAAIGLFLYLAFHQRRSRLRHVLAVLFGAMLLFAVKSKETGVCLMVLLPGFAEKAAGRFSFAETSKTFLRIAAGVIVAGAVFSILDYVYLEDPFFWCRFSNADALLGFNQGTYERGYDSWLGQVARGVPVMAFSLYLAVGLTSLRAGYRYHEKIAWLYPMLVLVFLTLTQIQGRWGILERYLFPALPFVCVWATQFFDFRSPAVSNRNNVGQATGGLGPWPRPAGQNSAELEGTDPPEADTEQPNAPSPTDRRAGMSRRRGAFIANTAKYLNLRFLSYLLIIALAIVIVIRIESKVYERAEPFGWDKPDQLYFSVILPTAVMFFWVGIVILKRGTRKWVFVAALSLFCAFYHPIANTVCLLANKAYTGVPADRFYPLKAFKEHLDLEGDVKIYVSRNMLSRNQRWRMLGRDLTTCMYMFNLYFRRNLGLEQFVSAEELNRILTTRCDYAILSAKEWQAAATTDLGLRLLQSYEVVREDSNRVVLLRRKKEENPQSRMPARLRPRPLG